MSGADIGFATCTQFAAWQLRVMLSTAFSVLLAAKLLFGQPNRLVAFTEAEPLVPKPVTVRQFWDDCLAVLRNLGTAAAPIIAGFALKVLIGLTTEPGLLDCCVRPGESLCRNVFGPTPS